MYIDAHANRQRRSPFRTFRPRRKAPAGLIFATAWIAGGVFGLWIGGMILRQYFGIDVLTPIEQEIQRWVEAVKAV